MPLYEYECPGCGRTFEKRVTFQQADAVTCPLCGNAYTKRKLSRVAIKGQQTIGYAPAPAPGGG